MAFSFGGNATLSESSSRSSSMGQSFVDPGQAPFLDFTRNLAQGLAQQQLGGMGNLFGLSQNLLGQGQDLLGGLGQTTNALSNIASPAVQQAQIGQLGSDLGAFFNQQILPGISRGAIGTGGLGGGRQGVAQGVAAGELARAFTGGATDIMAQGQQQQLSGLLGASQSQLGGLSSLGSLFGLGQAPFAAQFSPLLNLASIIGGPTVLSRQQAQSQSRSRSESGGFGFEFG